MAIERAPHRTGRGGTQYVSEGQARRVVPRELAGRSNRPYGAVGWSNSKKKTERI